MVIKKTKTIALPKTIWEDVVVPVYVASDGRAFDDEIYANNYERRLEIRKQVESLPYKYIKEIEMLEQNFFAFYCKTEEEFEKACSFVSYDNAPILGKNEWENEDWYCFCRHDGGDSVDEIEVDKLSDMRAAAKKFFSQFDEEV